MTNLDDLEAKARAATKSPWFAWNANAGWMVSRYQPEYSENDMMAHIALVGGDGSNAAFIAALNPTVALALIQCAQELQRIIDKGLYYSSGREELAALTRAMEGMQ